MPSPISKLHCKNSGCQRASLEICVNENGAAVIRVRNRHDGETHTSEFELEKIEKEVERLNLDLYKLPVSV